MSSSFADGKIPGLDAMNEGLSFVKNLWGGMQMPGMVTPTVSLEDLDKKIKDLKTVETWLTVNMNMLRGTIQALEVQRATVAALQSIGDSFAENMAKHGANMQANAPSAASSSSAVSPFGKRPVAPASNATGNNATWPMSQASAKSEPTPTPAPASSHFLWPTAPASAGEKFADKAEKVVSENATPAAEASPQAAATRTVASAPGHEHPSAGNVPFTNPAAWWNLLQDQFKQAVSNAMVDEHVIESKEHAVSTTPPASAKVKAPESASANTTSKANPASSRKSAKGAETGYLDEAKAVVKPRNKARVNLSKAPPSLNKKNGGN